MLTRFRGPAVYLSGETGLCTDGETRVDDGDGKSTVVGSASVAVIRRLSRYKPSTNPHADVAIYLPAPVSLQLVPPFCASRLQERVFLSLSPRLVGV